MISSLLFPQSNPIENRSVLLRQILFQIVKGQIAAPSIFLYCLRPVAHASLHLPAYPFLNDHIVRSLFLLYVQIAFLFRRWNVSSLLYLHGESLGKLIFRF